jgi:hypothetical protein
MIAPAAQAEEELWDNGLIYHWNAGRAISPPNFPNIRVADDFFVEDSDWRIHTVSATTIEDSGWTHGGTISVIIYEDTGNGPGPVFREVTTGFDRIATGDQYFGRREYHYWIRDLDIPVPNGRFWLTLRNPDGGGAGTNYWEGSDRGKDALRSSTGWFSLDAGHTWRAEGQCWHHAFQIFGERFGALAPVSFSVTRGVRTAGGLLAITETDDDRMVISARRPSAVSQPSIELNVEGVTSTRDPTGLSLRVEAAPRFPRTPTWFDFFNFREQRWERVAVLAMGRDDSCDRGGQDDVAVGGVTEDAARFVHPDTGLLRARVGFYDPGFTFAGWSVSIDWVGWIVTNN